MRPLLALALLAATACGLDDFSWGWGENCRVRWTMAFEGPTGADLVQLPVEDVQRLTRHAGNVAWSAWIEPLEQWVDLQISNFQLVPVRVYDPGYDRELELFGPCNHATAPAADRDRDLDRYACRLAVRVICFDRPAEACGPIPELQDTVMLFEETEFCPED